jgi:hypothetical protein
MQRRDAQADALYRCGVEAKCWEHVFRWSYWSPKTLGGMQLVVKPSAVEVVLKQPFRKFGFDTEWIFDARRTSMVMSRAPSPRILNREWIVLTADDGERPRMGRVDHSTVAIAGPRLEHMREALLECGVRWSYGE